MGIFDSRDYNDKIYGIVRLKRYEVEALEYQERTKGSVPLADRLHGLSLMADIDPLWLVGQKDGNWHGWLIAKIDTTDPEKAKKMFCQHNYDPILSLSYTDAIEEWNNKKGSWRIRI